MSEPMAELPLEETAASEAPGRRGRPPMTDEQKAAAKEARWQKKLDDNAALVVQNERRWGRQPYPPEQEFKFHQLCRMFPELEGKEFDELVEDMRQHGQREAGTVHKGKILDGRNRYNACRRLGIGFRARECDGDDPTGFVISANIHRRHMTIEQRRQFREELIKLHPEMSDRFIAGLARVDHKTIATDRTRLEGRGEHSPRETRTDTKGRQQLAHKPAPITTVELIKTDAPAPIETIDLNATNVPPRPASAPEPPAAEPAAAAPVTYVPLRSAAPAPIEVARDGDEIDRQAHYLIQRFAVPQLQRLVALLEEHLETVAADGINDTATTEADADASGP